ncbi:MAG: GNAT family N-acetyltransferase [Spirochaetes bacterium]|nr:GNAT family N-acetyltransferase [Spirochaetota bacterium]
MDHQSVEIRHEPGNIYFPQLLAKPYLIQFSNYRANVELEIDKGEYLIKTATRIDELDMVFRLRHAVFIEEMLGRKNVFGVDIDRFDKRCDHLMVIEKKTGKCVGTYRLISDVYSTEFYSATEFYLGNFLELKGVKLEIGRACIDPEYRRKNMMGLLWEGIYSYIGKIGVRYIFGCSSVMTHDRTAIAALYWYLQQNGHILDEFGVRPRKKYAIPTLKDDIEAVRILGDEYISNAAMEVLPRLLKDYFQFGAKVCGEPAFDKSFNCADFFTVLDLQNLNDHYKKERIG